MLHLRKCTAIGCYEYGHGIRSKADLHVLEGYLEEAKSKPENLCIHLDLENCNSLKNRNALDSFNLAENYLRAYPHSCWDDIVDIFCKLEEYTLAHEISKKHGEDFNGSPIEDCSKSKHYN